MATWQDKFDRANSDLVGSYGWEAINSSTVGTGVLQVKQQYCTHTNGGPGGYGFLSDTSDGNAAVLPASASQEVSAWIGCTREGSTSKVEIGINGNYNATYASIGLGVFARFEWKANNERVLSIYHRLGNTLSSGETSDTELATLTLVDNAGTVQENWKGFLVDNGAVNALQNMRLVVSAEDQGIAVRAYLNNTDDENPTLEAYLRSDLVIVDSSNFPYGQWWIYVGGDSSNNDVTYIAEISAQDYILGGRSTTADRKESTIRGDHPTLRELRERVIKRFSGSSETDLSDFEVDELVRDEVEHLLNVLGDQAVFLIRHEELSVTMDSEGHVTLPDYIERLYSMEPNGQRRPADWAFDHYDSNGNLVIRMNPRREADGVYLAQYLQRWERMSFDDDQCPVPRRHAETIILAACRTLAQTRERSMALAQSYDALYQSRLIATQREMARHWRQRKIRLRPARRAVAPPNSNPLRRY